MENWLQASLVKNPESVFSESGLTYKSSEIDQINERFSRAADYRPVHQFVRELLQTTSDFRHATVPEGWMQQLRSETKEDEELNNTFITMNDAFLKAEKEQQSLDEDDQKILALALNYCKKSIKKRIAMLKPDDRLLPFWHASELKKRIG